MADLRSRLCHQELEPEYQSLRSASQRSAQHVKLYRAWENRRLKGVRTIADGIAVKEPGIHTFDLCQQYVDEIVSVTDDEISTAILALIEQHKLIAEGAGAVAVAAAMFNKVPIKGKKVICLISGGNIDVNILSRVIGRGLQKSGRSCSMTIDW